LEEKINNVDDLVRKSNYLNALPAREIYSQLGEPVIGDSEELSMLPQSGDTSVGLNSVSYEISLVPSQSNLSLLWRDIFLCIAWVQCIFLFCTVTMIVLGGWQKIVAEFADYSIIASFGIGIVFGIIFGTALFLWNSLLQKVANKLGVLEKITASPEYLIFPISVCLVELGSSSAFTRILYGVRKSKAAKGIHQSWNTIHTIQIRGLESWDISKWRSRSFFAEAGLEIYVHAGASIFIPFKLLSKAEATKLFLALEAFGDPTTFSSEAMEVKHAMLMSADLYDSSQSAWEASLGLNYSTTNFGTLPFNYQLQNGRYQIITQIAGRGMSAVYVAKNESGEKVIAKETMLPFEAADIVGLKTKELVERESKILSKVAHPQIAKIFDYFIERQRVYLILEYIPGPTLRQLVHKNGPLPAQRARKIVAQLAEILIYLHNQKPPLIHRDISPDNIILGDDNEIVLIDFGAANEFVERATGTFIGKQSYISPEQFKGKAEPCSDIYSLGGTMYFLLTGRDPVPLSEAHPKAVNSKISSDLDALVAQCTKQDLEERFGNGQILLAHLHRLSLSEISEEA
jgi:tRNA A-37 threonylcarbamoyl transferase component Bud32